jgi:hypothetical protein
MEPGKNHERVIRHESRGFHEQLEGQLEFIDSAGKEGHGAKTKSESEEESKKRLLRLYLADKIAR